MMRKNQTGGLTRRDVLDGHLDLGQREMSSASFRNLF